MHPAHHVVRFKLALAALLLGLGALYVQHTGILPLKGQYTATTVLRTGLLPDVLTLSALVTTISAPGFVGALDAPARIDTIPGQPSHFRLTVSHPVAKVAKDGLNQARELLGVELKTLATREVKISLKKMEEHIENERQRRQARKTTPQVTLRASSQTSLTSRETRRVLKLQRENEAVKAFLSGGSYPAWLRTRLEGRAVRRLSKRIAEDKAELTRLQSLWKDSSNPVIAAQQRLLDQQVAERRRVRIELANAFLKDNTIELKALEEKNLAIVQEREVAPEIEDTSLDDDDLTSADFLHKRTQELIAKAKRQENQASLEIVTPLELTQKQALGYWVSLCCWATSLLCLLAALFARTSGRATPQEEPPRALEELRTPSLPLSLGRQSPSLTPVSPEPQALLQGFYEKLRKNLGREPKKLLVLGNEEGLARSSFTLRLANSLGKAKGKVRLVDFDLPEKELSVRFSAGSTPGVSDILCRGGPVEEFFASLPGTNIEFAAAGSRNVLHEPICDDTLRSLLKDPESGITVVDASFNSPLHLLIGHVDAVLCLTKPGTEWKQQEEEILVALRDSKLPLWGVARGGTQIFPFI